MTIQNITVLGSTGSIGGSTLDVVAMHPERYQVYALAANSQVDKLFAQCQQFQPAFAVLVDAYWPRIFRWLHGMTNHTHAAEDLTQDVFIRIYRTLDQYDPKQGDLSNWLMRLARNLIIDDYRHRQRNPQNTMADAVDDHSYHLRAAGTSAQKEMERKELASQVQEGIDKLPNDLRTCVILRDIEELTYQEIVDVLKIPEGTVKSRINRGRIELAKILRRMRVVTI